MSPVVVTVTAGESDDPAIVITPLGLSGVGLVGAQRDDALVEPQLLGRPVPDESKTDQDSLTVALLPMVTGLGDAENELIVGGGQGVTVTVVWAEVGAPQLPPLEILTLFRVLPGV